MIQPALGVVPLRQFDEAEALAWLRSRGKVKASAAELGRQWGWNKVRAGRRLKAWQAAGQIHRRGDTITVTEGVTGPVTERAAVTPRFASPVRMAALFAALALAAVSAGFSIDGLTAIFRGAFWPVVTMGVALEAGKLVAAAWLGQHWRIAPRSLRAILVALVAVLMGLNAIGAFGFLSKAHLEHVLAADLAIADRAADIDARLAVQVQVVADLDRRIGQIDTAIEESTRRGRTVAAMGLAEQQRRARGDLAAVRQREAQALAGMQIEKSRVDALRKRAQADVGPVRYLAQLIGGPEADLERAVRFLTAAVVAVLDPLVIALLLAAA